MLKRRILFGKGSRAEIEDSSEHESGPMKFPRKPLARGKKRASRPGGLTPQGMMPDAKRYNDDIPDPDDEDIIPE